MNKEKDKKVLMWVDPLFKSTLKIRAAENDTSIIKLTRRIAQKDLLKGDKRDDDEIRV